MLYTYPDGTRSNNRPKDGEIFTLYCQGVVQSTWQWDDALVQWFNVSSGQPTKQNTASFTYRVTSIGISGIDVTIDLNNLSVEPECECGAKHTSCPQNHLRFCKLFKPQSSITPYG
jgi:hypothetical protein